MLYTNNISSNDGLILKTYMQHDFELLNKDTYLKTVIESIKNAKKNIVIFSYIWLHDKNGKKVGQELLNAAQRGVKILIGNDSTGLLYEYAHNNTPLLFNRNNLKKSLNNINHNPSLLLSTLLQLPAQLRKKRLQKNLIYNKFLSHKNISVYNAPFFNHAKTIIIDKKLMFVGGQYFANICDTWIDYTLKISSAHTVQNGIKSLLSQKPPTILNQSFVFLNNKPKYNFNLQTFCHEFIKNTQNRLYINMAYLSINYVEPLLDIIQEKKHVYLYIPQKTDASKHINLYFLHELVKKADKYRDYIHMYVSDEMVHAKCMIRDPNTSKATMTIGSFNLLLDLSYTYTLEEHNIYLTSPQIVNDYFTKIFKTEDYKKINHISEIPQPNKIIAIIENLFINFSSWIIHKKRHSIQKYRSFFQEKINELL